MCLCQAGELTVVSEDDSLTLHENDSVRLGGNAIHRVENTGETRALGSDVFAPGRS